VSAGLAVACSLVVVAVYAHQLVQGGFASHMLVHVLNVGLVAPMLACLAVRYWRSGRAGTLASAWPVGAAFAELIVVWGWHVPVAHEAARGSLPVFLFEQASFLAVSWWLWWSALVAVRSGNQALAGQSIAAMLFTSMHMTLLGSVLGLAPRAFYGDGAHGVICSTNGIEQMHLGGAVMLVAAGTVYLVGALWLAWHLLKPERASDQAAQER